MSVVNTRPTIKNRNAANIRADLSQYCAMKSLFEQILGRNSFMSVKDYGSLRTWKRETLRLLGSITLSIASTVEVVDEEWKEDVKELLDFGKSRIQSAESIDELFAALAATLGELTFLQLGFIPMGHYRLDRVPLIKKNWKMNPVRTIQYVQSGIQRETQVRLRERRSGAEDA